MHVISRIAFRDAALAYPNHAAAIDGLYKTLKSGSYTQPDQLRAKYPSLDNFKYRDKWWVIDIGGNSLRLIAFIEFRYNRIYVKHIVNHADYDKLCKRYAKGGLS